MEELLFSPPGEQACRGWRGDDEQGGGPAGEADGNRAGWHCHEDLSGVRQECSHQARGLYKMNV